MKSSENPRSPADVGTTSNTLLDGLKIHTENSWRRFVETYRPVILFWVLKKIRNRDIANDLTQNVLVAVHENMSKFDRQEGAAKFRAWLKTITHNKVTDYFRKQKEVGVGGTDAHLALGQVEQEIIGDTEEKTTELILLVQTVVSTMKTRYREPQWLSFWRTTVDGLDAKQVSEELGISHALVRKNKQRVMEALQKELVQLDVMDFLSLELSQLDDLLDDTRKKPSAPSEK